jgi:phage shock protein A
MAYRLRMPAEIGAWLAELAGSQPEAAAEIGAALLALLRADTIPGRPLVHDPDEPWPSLYPDPETAADPREALDLLYHHLLEGLQKTRREVADAATNRKQIEDQLAADPDPALRGPLDRQLAAARDLETVSTRLAQQLQAMVDRFRTRKETAKATAVAAEVIARIRQYADDIDVAGPDPVITGVSARDSAARVEQLLAEGQRLLTLVHEGAASEADRRSSDRDRVAAYSAAGGSRSRPATDLLELRADPLGSGALIFFAEEPIGTLTLLAVLDDRHAVAEHHDAAFDLAGRFLEQIRDDGWPAGGLAFARPESFVTHFLPGRDADLDARAAARAATVTLTRLRDQASLSMAQVAELAGLGEGQVKVLELRGPAYGEVEVLAAYARALGGTLRLTVDLDGARHIVL